MQRRSFLASFVTAIAVARVERPVYAAPRMLRTDNAALSTLMDQRVTALATLARLQESHDPWERILMDLRIEITL